MARAICARCQLDNPGNISDVKAIWRHRKLTRHLDEGGTIFEDHILDDTFFRAYAEKYTKHISLVTSLEERAEKKKIKRHAEDTLRRVSNSYIHTKAEVKGRKEKMERERATLVEQGEDENRKVGRIANPERARIEDGKMEWAVRSRNGSCPPDSSRV